MKANALAASLASVADAARSPAPLRAMGALSLSFARRLARLAATAPAPSEEEFEQAIARSDAAEVARMAPFFSPAWRNERGSTALMLAAERGSLECAQALLPFSLPQLRWKKNARSSAPHWIRDGHEGDTALMMAVRSGNVGLVRLLAAQPGADIVRGDRHTALTLAASRGESAMVRELAATGCLEREDAREGRSALESAALNGRLDTVDALLELGACPSAAAEATFSPLAAAATGAFEMTAASRSPGRFFFDALGGDLGGSPVRAVSRSAQNLGHDTVQVQIFQRIWHALDDGQKRAEARRSLAASHQSDATIRSILAFLVRRDDVDNVAAMLPFCPPSDGSLRDPLRDALVQAAVKARADLAVRLIAAGAAPFQTDFSLDMGALGEALGPRDKRGQAGEECARAIAQALPFAQLPEAVRRLGAIAPAWLCALVESRELAVAVADVSAPAPATASGLGTLGQSGSESAATPTDCPAPTPRRKARAL
jgi:ankyrin repeat protein